MPRKTSPIKYNLHPEFPAAAVERYPSLTSALGDSYPRLTASVEEDSQNASSGQPFESSVPVPSIQSTFLGILADDQISPERMHTSFPNTSLLSNNSFSEPGRLDQYLNLQDHSTNASVDSHCFVPIRYSDGPCETTSDRGNLHSPSSFLSPLPTSRGIYTATVLSSNPALRNPSSNVEGQPWGADHHACQDQPFIAIASPLAPGLPQKMKISPKTYQGKVPPMVPSSEIIFADGVGIRQLIQNPPTALMIFLLR
ncbi:hypothetical protein MSAN_01926900 [Mycena sanguinolenta]|uniref:Uncharacterized protein n=1 Tax=Mycena sanguinolenta TaxID=230812 RepID=A0A8H6XNC2_9AGAR|nr:hypothetical protein MSAN_01926900 [Mycena sanguinolenta]